MPRPRVADDHLEFGISTGPAEHLTGTGGCRDEFWRVSGAPRRFDSWHGSATDAGHCIDHLAHGMSVSSAEVDRLTGSAGGQAIERAQMRVGQVHHVDVVADRSPVRGRITGAEDL